MASLADLFNPSFFIILGIVALLIALVVVYFETKMREQNHKIASMLSLVSTLAEDMNGVKMGLNHLAFTVSNGGGSAPQNLGLVDEEEKSQHLIEVSDDEEEEDDEDEVEEEVEEDEDVEEEDLEEDEDVEEEDVGDEETDLEEEEETDSEPIKVIKLNISENMNDCDIEETNIDFELDDNLEDMGEIPEISEEYTEEMLNLNYDEILDEKPLAEDQVEVPSASELKTISINLGEDSQSEHIEYKKLQLPKLRSITVEKGLTSSSEAQKLKKPELLKLLGVD